MIEDNFEFLCVCIVVIVIVLCVTAYQIALLYKPG